METLVIILVIAILLMIAYLIYINQRTLNKVVNYKRSKEELKISDERYYELNNKIQLLIVVSSIILLIGGFVGYNSINSIKGEISSDIEHYKKNLMHYDSTIIKYKRLIGELENDRDTVINVLRTSIIEVNDIKNTLIQLQEDYKLNAKTFFVTGIKVPPESESDEFVSTRRYFKDMKMPDGKRLPKFKVSPFLSVMGKGLGFVIIKNITKDYFEYFIMGVISYEEGLENVSDKPQPDEVKNFDLLIIERINYN